MPRITRAQLRAQDTKDPQDFYEDPETKQDTTAEAGIPPETNARAALGELVNVNSNAFQKPETLPCAETLKESKKNSGSGKNRLNLVLAEDENILPSITPDIIEDEYPSDDSSAAKAAAKELRVGSPDLVLVDTTTMQSMPSAAAEQANRALNRSPERNAIAVHGSVNTPKFDPSQHSRMALADESGHDSFEVDIKTRTPVPITDTHEGSGSGSDSFVDDITSRSPSKITSRIEDSVEALDALDDAIEQVSGELPKDMPSTPAKVKKPRTEASKPINKPSSKVKQPATARTESSKKPITQKPTRPTAVRTKPRQSISASATGNKIVAAGRPSVGARPVSAENKRASSGPLSTSKPGFVPAKSTKQPTKSTFTLPGEAISAKMTAKRDELRLKKEAEEKKRSKFKARPAPKAVGAGQRRVSSIEPRGNATSRARIGMAVVIKKAEDVDAKKASGLSPNKTFKASSPLKATKPLPRTSSVPSKTSFQRLSVPKARNSQPGTPRTPANTSAPRRNMVGKPLSSRKPISVRKPATVPAATTLKARVKKQASPSTTTASTKPTGPTSAAPKLATGKEVFNRGKLAEAEAQKVKKIKEEAAKKAREAAAERGRQASREWALKKGQKSGNVKPTVAATTKTDETTVERAGEKDAQETEKLVMQEPPVVVMM